MQSTSSMGLRRRAGHFLILGGIAMLCAAAALVADRAADAGNGEYPVLYDQYGRVIRDETGRRINYERWEEPAPKPPGDHERPAEPADEERQPSSLQVDTEWIWTVYGSYIGYNGLHPADLDGDGNLEVVAGATADGSSNNYWYVMRHTAGEYPRVWNRLEYPSPIHSLRTYDLNNDGDDEVLVGVGSNIVVYDGFAPVEIRTIATVASAIRGLRIADVDSDGALELVFCDDSSLFIYHYASGALEEQVFWRGSDDVAIGQVDFDDGLEIVLGGRSGTSGWVLDGATRALEWENRAGFGRFTRTGDLDGDGRDEIVAGDDWYLISVYDAERQALSYTIPVDVDLSALQVIDVEGDGTPEIIYGDGQWGEIHVMNGATGAEKWQIPNPDHSTTSIAIADVDADGTRELLWGAGHTGGSNHLYVADTVTRDTEWQTIDIVGPFRGLDWGDVDADGANELLHISKYSDDLDNGFYFLHGAASKIEEYRNVPPPRDYSWGVFRIGHAQVDGDPQHEIFVAIGGYYSGTIVAYDGLSHAEQWHASGSAGALRVADVDQDGAVEVVVAGEYVYVFDAATGGLEWQSASLGGAAYFLRVANVDGDANPEIVTALHRGGVRIFDGVTHVEQLASGTDTTALATPDRDGDGIAEVLVGMETGTIKVIDPASGATLETIGNYGARIDGLAVLDLTLDGVADYVFCSADELRVADGSDGGLIYSSGDIGDEVGRLDTLLAADIDADGNPEIVTNLGKFGILVSEVPFNQPETPVVTIDSPTDGSAYFEGDLVSFAGAASDPEDGDLSTSILWSSDLDGPLGTGSSLEVSTLSIGTHRITAAVTDSDAFQGSDQILILIKRTTLFKAGNIIVSSDYYDEIREYTKTGVLVRTIPVPPNETVETQRDLVLDVNADILHIFNGTRDPVLSSYAYPGSWSEHTYAGWSIYNGGTYGGIATQAGFVFVTDMGPDRGIVRFDTMDDYTATRFGEISDYIDLTIGLDCRLYALRDSMVSYQTVDVFDPLTTDFLGSVLLRLGGPGTSLDLTGIAVSPSGEFFAAAWNGNIYHFDTSGNLVNSIDGTVGSLCDINLNLDGDIVVVDRDDVILLTTTALTSVSTVVDVNPDRLDTTFVAFAGGELAPDCPSCGASRSLVADQWKMISLPCDVGSNSTVQGVFGDDLDPADYGDRWGIYKYSELNQIYRLLGLSSPLKEGKGYWIKTLDSGQSITVGGELPSAVDRPLVADPEDGAQNLVGHPFNFGVCWDEVRILDGASVLTLDQADPLIGFVRACQMVPPDPSCVASRIGYQWNGAAYEVFDGQTMGMQGTLEPFDGLWVKAFKSGVELRIPPSPGTGCTFCSPQPIADAGPGPTICLGDAVTIGTAAQAGHTYSWSPGGETTAQITVSPASTTIYTVTSTTICGSAQDTVMVSVDDGAGGLGDDFEGDVSGWTATGLWHLVDDTACWNPTPGYASPTHAFYYGQDATCNFNVGDTAGTLTSPPITGIHPTTQLTFKYLRWAETSTYRDKCEVRIIHPGGTDTVFQITWYATSWTPTVSIPLADYVGQTIQVQLSFDSNGTTSNTGKGWLIDDVVVGTGGTCSKGMTGGSELLSVSEEESASPSAEPRPWLVRLAAESGDLRDANNVFGLLADARDGYDYHDLAEPPPFGERYLSIVFRHDDWYEYAGDYTSDFHAADSRRGEWHFDVIAGGLSGPVTLRWAGEATDLSGMFLVDEATGERIRIEPFGSYSFAMENERRSFRWIHGELFSDGFESGDLSSWSGTTN
ncbi:MAG: hypothetical protein GY856_38810 [bacterium]|nr:hypothetical protein [bacterium]